MPQTPNTTFQGTVCKLRLHPAPELRRYASLAHPIRPMCCPHAAHFIIGNSIPSCTTMNVLFLHAAHAENEICSCCVLSFLKARKTTLSFMSWPLLGITFWSSGAVEAALRRPAYRHVKPHTSKLNIFVHINRLLLIRIGLRRAMLGYWRCVAFLGRI